MNASAIRHLLSAIELGSSRSVRVGPRRFVSSSPTPFRQAYKRDKHYKHWSKLTFSSVTNTSDVTLAKHKNPRKHWFVTLARFHTRSGGREKQPSPKTPFVLFRA